MKKFYKFTTYRPYQKQLPNFPKDIVLDLHCEQNILRVSIFNQMMTVYPSYAWDGCSPKKILKTKKGHQLCVGVWDGFITHHEWDNGFSEPCQQLKYASLVHDVFCQFWEQLEGKVDKKYIDKLFYEMAEASGFPFPSLYYYGIKFGTTIYSKGRIS